MTPGVPVKNIHVFQQFIVFYFSHWEIKFIHVYFKDQPRGVLLDSRGILLNTTLIPVMPHPCAIN